MLTMFSFSRGFPRPPIGSSDKEMVDGPSSSPPGGKMAILYGGVEIKGTRM